MYHHIISSAVFVGKPAIKVLVLYFKSGLNINGDTDIAKKIFAHRFFLSEDHFQTPDSSDE